MAVVLSINARLFNVTSDILFLVSGLATSWLTMKLLRLWLIRRIKQGHGIPVELLSMELGDVDKKRMIKQLSYLALAGVIILALTIVNFQHTIGDIGLDFITEPAVSGVTTAAVFSVDALESVDATPLDPSFHWMFFAETRYGSIAAAGNPRGVESVTSPFSGIFQYAIPPAKPIDIGGTKPLLSFESDAIPLLSAPSRIAMDCDGKRVEISDGEIFWPEPRGQMPFSNCSYNTPKQATIKTRILAMVQSLKAVSLDAFGQKDVSFGRYNQCTVDFPSCFRVFLGFQVAREYTDDGGYGRTLGDSISALEMGTSSLQLSNLRYQRVGVFELADNSLFLVYSSLAPRVYLTRYGVSAIARETSEAGVCGPTGSTCLVYFETICETFAGDSPDASVLLDYAACVMGPTPVVGIQLSGGWIPGQRTQLRLLFALTAEVGKGILAEDVAERVLVAVANAILGAFDLEETQTYSGNVRPEINALWFLALLGFPIVLALVFFGCNYFVRESWPLPTTVWEGMQVGKIDGGLIQVERSATDPFEEPSGYYGVSNVGGEDRLGYTNSPGNRGGVPLRDAETGPDEGAQEQSLGTIIAVDASVPSVQTAPASNKSTDFSKMVVDYVEHHPHENQQADGSFTDTYIEEGKLPDGTRGRRTVRSLRDVNGTIVSQSTEMQKPVKRSH